MQSAVRLIVGLGNPGAEYTKTRHNAGVWFLDAFSAAESLVFTRQKRLNALVCKLNTDPVYLALPQSFMNNSGQVVAALLHYYRLKPSDLLIVHDELDFEPGKIRLKWGGGHAGHNGLRSIIQHIGTNDFYRLRIGIGHPGSKNLVHQYVLSLPSKKEKDLITNNITAAIPCVSYCFAGDIEKSMQCLSLLG